MSIELLIYAAVTVFAFGRGWQKVWSRLDSIEEKLSTDREGNKKVARRVGRIHSWAVKHELKHKESTDAGLAQ